MTKMLFNNGGTWIEVGESGGTATIPIGAQCIGTKSPASAYGGTWSSIILYNTGVSETQITGISLKSSSTENYPLFGYSSAHFLTGKYGGTSFTYTDHYSTGSSGMTYTSATVSYLRLYTKTAN